MECIHGLDDGLCDVCFPKAVPEPSPGPRSATSPSGSRRTPRPKVGSADRRLHHVTRVDDLADILAAGQLLEGTTWSERPPVSPFDRVVLVSTSLRITQRGGRMIPGGAEVFEAFPFDEVALVAVANEPVRDLVKGIVDDADFETRVAVYPPWFAKS